eukprot:snap_masked-scaffold_4-processed-gene-7.52-mRNA-1 protein AED:1.00 eAED:1.00 QI:0/-1/0/0/-1/1/1/0/105
MFDGTTFQILISNLIEVCAYIMLGFTLRCRNFSRFEDNLSLIEPGNGPSLEPEIATSSSDTRIVPDQGSSWNNKDTRDFAESNDAVLILEGSTDSTRKSRLATVN